MPEPVIPMSTREWQRWKLGPSLQREVGWMRCDMRAATTAFRLMLDVFSNLIRTLSDIADALARALGCFQQVYTELVTAYSPVATDRFTYELYEDGVEAITSGDELTVWIDDDDG